MSVKTRIVIELDQEESEYAAYWIRDLLKRVHAVEREWEKDLGESSAFLNGPVRFEIQSSRFEVWQTGQPLRFADET